MDYAVVRAHCQLANVQDVTSALYADARTASSQPKQYVKQNKLGYYVIINTWLLMIRDFSEDGWIYVLAEITKRGLLPIVGEAVEASAELIDGATISNGIWAQIVRDIEMVVNPNHRPLDGTAYGISPMTTSLGVLRYPKRFSPIGADVVRKNSIRDFLNIEGRSKKWQRRPYNAHLLGYVQHAMLSLLPWEDVCRDIRTELEDPFNLEFSSGVAYDSRSSLGSKLEAVARQVPWAWDNQIACHTVWQQAEEPWDFEYGLPSNYLRSDDGLIIDRSGYFAGWRDVPVPDKELSRLELLAVKRGNIPRPTRRVPAHFHTVVNYHYRDTKRRVKVQAVPKSYKAARIIAMEDTYRGGRAHVVARVLDRYLPPQIRLHDQTQNQELAYYGSLDGEVATIDLSSASDTITKTHFWDIFPSEFSRLVYPLLGTHTMINGTERVMQQMSTSGNALTFILESLVFLAIDIAAQDLAVTYGEDPAPEAWEGLPVPSVYGDDQIVWSRCYEWTVGLLTALGFIVNESKSFAGDVPFRESCGADWYLGEEVSSIYFPRFPISGSITDESLTVNQKDWRWDGYRQVAVNSLSSLISLQHRLYGRCKKAATFVRCLVLESFPRMTISSYGSERSDLWDYDVSAVKRWAPGLRASHPDYAVAGDLTQERLFGRLWHYAPHTQYSLSGALTDEQRELYDKYKLAQFLRYGPRYADDLMRMLGISEAPRPVEEVFGRPETVWRLTEATEM